MLHRISVTSKKYWTTSSFFIGAERSWASTFSREHCWPLDRNPRLHPGPSYQELRTGWSRVWCRDPKGTRKNKDEPKIVTSTQRTSFCRVQQRCQVINKFTCHLWAKIRIDFLRDSESNCDMEVLLILWQICFIIFEREREWWGGSFEMHFGNG